MQQHNKMIHPPEEEEEPEVSGPSPPVRPRVLVIATLQTTGSDLHTTMAPGEELVPKASLTLDY